MGHYGAQAYRRVRTAIRFLSLVCVSYIGRRWLLLMLFPRFLQSGIFSDRPSSSKRVRIRCSSTFGCFMMSLQMAGQAAAHARALEAGDLLPAAQGVIVIPLLILPQIPGVGVTASFGGGDLEFLGGGACFYHDALHDLAGTETKETAQAR